MEAVLLVGGFGKRLKPLTDATPKAMVDVDGKPILFRQIQWLRDHGVSRFVLAVSHLKEVIFDAVGNGAGLGVQVKYAVEEAPLGTAGAISNASALLGKNNEYVFVLNGDVLTNLNVTKLIATLNANRSAVGTLSLVPLPSPYGIVETEGSVIKGFIEKPLLKDYWINAGVYCFRPEIFSSLPEQGSLEHDVFPKLASQGRLLSYKESNCFWVSVDGFKDLEKASTFYQKESFSYKRTN